MLSLRSAFRSFSRAPLLSLLSITTIAFSLFAFGLFGLVQARYRHIDPPNAADAKSALRRTQAKVIGH